MKDIRCLENYPVIMTVSDIADFIEKSAPLAYMLAEQKKFPSVKLGGRVLVMKKHFELWLNQ